ncbi:DsrE family protein [Archaeoglobus neptunius]|uniref:DsrE family protein n=1 Tax=Archaeoglobus neptunius TaxID=2798580 RepID=UPI0019296904|nr:DsrE family protein [Archaeoglobus neptunius]
MAKIVYVQTSGTDTPERLYVPFILAMTAKAMGDEAIIYFVVKGVTVVKRGNAEKIKIGQFPTLKEVMDQAVQSGVEMMVCDRSSELLGIDSGEIVEGVKVVGAATLNQLVLEADAALYF